MAGDHGRGQPEEGGRLLRTAALHGDPVDDLEQGPERGEQVRPAGGAGRGSDG
ncbi:hypothetical protein AB0O01_27460 [Streptomyces sp. NPDC093252]|uniref:hypothetical protein n=1 Tax=Streptomyces sp. NPDC093252 TaxID=3154980 RepID=UPI0034227C2C